MPVRGIVMDAKPLWAVPEVWYSYSDELSDALLAQIRPLTVIKSYLKANGFENVSVILKYETRYNGPDTSQILQH